MSNWMNIKVRDLGRVVTGKTPPKVQPAYYNGKYMFVSPKDMERDSTFIQKTETTLTELAIKKFKNQVIPKNSVMYTILSYGFGKIGIAAEDVLTNQQITSIIVNANHCFKFVYYLLRANTDYFFTFNSGIDTPLVPKSVFENADIKVPDLETQKKISNFLWTLDELVAANLRRIELFDSLVKLIYSEWFINFKFPNYEQIKLVDSNHADFGMIPDGWSIQSVGDIIERKPAGKLYSNKTVLKTGKVPVLDQGQSGVIGFHNDEPSCLASPEDPIIVFSNHTCYQRLIFTPFSAIQNVLPFKPSTSMKRDIYWLHVATKGIVTLNDYKGHWPELISKKIIVPKTEITEQFGHIAKNIFHMISLLEDKNKILVQVRDALLPKLISGEIDVSEVSDLNIENLTTKKSINNESERTRL